MHWIIFWVYMSAKDTSVALYHAATFDGRLQGWVIEVYPLPYIRPLHRQVHDSRRSPLVPCMCGYLATGAPVDLPSRRVLFLDVELLAFLVLELARQELDIGI